MTVVPEFGRALCAFICCCCLFSEALSYDLYKDASQPVEVRVKDLLQRMTLAEKVGQMTQIERSVVGSSTIRNNFIVSEPLNWMQGVC